MLFKKTLKVASATALWMVALLGANSAMAQTPPPAFSAETLMGTGPAYAVEAAADLSASLAVNASAQFEIQNAGTVASGNAVWIRVSAGGVLRLTTQPSVQIGTLAAGATPGTAPTLQAALGDGEATTTGSAYIFPVVGRPGSATDNTVNITAVVGDNADTNVAGGADLEVTGPGAATLEISVHGNKRDANFGSGTPFHSGTTTLLTVARSVTAMGKAGPVNTALAATRFTAIDGKQRSTTPYEINLGGFDITVNGAHRNASTGNTLVSLTADAGTPDDTTDDPTAGTEMTLWQQTGVNGGTRFYGDGGWDFVQGFRLAAQYEAGADGCSGAGPMGGRAGPQEGNGEGIVSSPLSEEDPTDDVVTAIAVNPWYLCVTISNENETTIPRGTYSVDVNLTPTRADNERAFPPMSAAGLEVGTIAHDGTTVQIPFVTSYDGYTQRIVIVNRNKVDVGYAITFRVEGDGEIMGDNPHEGMLMADQATVVKVADLVTLSNPTRAAATLTVAAKSGTIDVATTMVNKMDQSTDTVVLMPE